KTRSAMEEASSSTGPSLHSKGPPSSPRMVATSAPVSWRMSRRANASPSSVRDSHLRIRSYDAESRSRSVVMPHLPVLVDLDEAHADVRSEADARELHERADEFPLRGRRRRRADRCSRGAAAADKLVPGVGALPVVE